MAKNAHRNRIREKDVEDYLIKNIRKIGGMCEKWRAVDKRGVPDRIVILPWMGTFFVEVKSSDGTTTRLQEYTFVKIRNAGGAVYVVYGHEGVDKLMDEILTIKKKVDAEIA